MNANEEITLTPSSKAKLTTSFKCSADYKDNLAQQANGVDMSLSEYIEARLQYSEKLEEELDDIKSKLSVYECPKLREHLKRLAGKVIQFIDADGNEINVTVNSLPDVYKILVHSFQIGNNL